MSRSVLAGFGALVLAGLLLSGCATPSGGDGGSDEPSSTPDESVTPDPDLGAAWLDDGRMIGLVTLGSSTCVPVAESPELDDEGVLQVTLATPEADKPCTADLVPRVTLVGVPEGVDPELDLPIDVTGDDYFGHVDLAGVPGLTGGTDGTDYLPSAGWATAPGQFVILTWGSSSCPPVIENVEATGETEVTVTYATPPADQVCTMDMAPRAAVAAVNDMAESSDIEAILTGGEFDNVKIPIYGTNS